LFYLLHQSLFPVEKTWDLLSIFSHALRFDLSALCYVNFVLILSYLLPLPQRNQSWYKTLQRWIFVIFNGTAVLFEMVDIAYFPFVLRRTNAGDLALAENTFSLLPLFLRDYWFLIILYVSILLFLWWTFKKWALPSPTNQPSLISQISVLITCIPLLLIASRGGLQLRPLMPLNAQQYVPDVQLVPLVYPTTLGLIFSTQQKFIEEKEYFSEDEVSNIFPIHHKYHNKSSDKSKPNVVVIILESVGQEYSNLLANRKHGFTPFLDSLLEQSYYFELAFANGMRSTQGIAAISASIPALMEDPFLFSAYQANNIDGIGKLLKKEGYRSAFFHGANPGSMEFEDFARLCGFDDYFDRETFNDDEFYDGHWGIWDRPFFQFTAQTLDSFPQPFYAQLFSLSSHHPYQVEPYFEELYPDHIPMTRSVKYTDEALRQFFATAEASDWFDNTLFIITSDHTGKSRISTYQTATGRYRIPLLLYKPDGSLKGQPKSVAQQIDILPTIMDYIGSNSTFTAFGKSLLDSTDQRYGYFYFQQTYRILDEQYYLLFNGEESIGLYNYRKDVKLKYNLMAKKPIERKRLERQLKAVIQQHHNSLIRNKLSRK
ncbi:MAG: LTA synthase family protein, partial [Saprospiraceae bacterium]